MSSGEDKHPNQREEENDTSKSFLFLVSSSTVSSRAHSHSSTPASRPRPRLRSVQDRLRNPRLLQGVGVVEGSVDPLHLGSSFDLLPGNLMSRLTWGAIYSGLTAVLVMTALN
ncbi:hypothetical protein MLD38_016142 [Melastoma candidum]|uniref:Uncharacterized protein n=1 Tax=Melastoma candidum TaxID=119954 RepID=A0ACB9RIL8_9MYRT|nr:hypothetical protein MLD38_016142 [Melastoma candidum]